MHRACGRTDDRRCRCPGLRPPSRECSASSHLPSHISLLSGRARRRHESRSPRQRPASGAPSFTTGRIRRSPSFGRALRRTGAILRTRRAPSASARPNPPRGRPRSPTDHNCWSTFRVRGSWRIGALGSRLRGPGSSPRTRSSTTCRSRSGSKTRTRTGSGARSSSPTCGPGPRGGSRCAASGGKRPASSSRSTCPSTRSACTKAERCDTASRPPPAPPGPRHRRAITW